jgi:hypothetical protein
MSIKLVDINPSYISELDNPNLVFGGSSLLQNYYGVPNYFSSIVITPVGGTKANVQAALDTAVGYADLNGFVSEVLHGGSFGFLATQPLFLNYEQLA